MLSSLVIATRKSPLALWQAEFVKARLEALYPTCAIELLPMVTEGDRRLEVALANVGGKGLFIKELETAIADGRAHLAVHSLKDVPMHMPEGFVLSAILEREDPRDAFISHQYAHPRELPEGAKVGTSSPRRATQLKHRYPHLKIELLRGNVGTRLRRLAEGDFDAILLAAAGLIRLGLFNPAYCTLLSIEESLPAVGQGALAIECAENQPALAHMLAPLNHEGTAVCVQAERAFSQSLSGNCHMPIAAHASLQEDDTRLEIHGYVGHPERAVTWQGSLDAPLNAFDSLSDASELGWLLGRRCQLETPWLDEVLGHSAA